MANGTTRWLLQRALPRCAWAQNARAALAASCAGGAACCWSAQQTTVGAAAAAANASSPSSASSDGSDGLLLGASIIGEWDQDVAACESMGTFCNWHWSPSCPLLSGSLAPQLTAVCRSSTICVAGPFLAGLGVPWFATKLVDCLHTALSIRCGVRLFQNCCHGYCSLRYSHSQPTAAHCSSLRAVVLTRAGGRRVCHRRHDALRCKHHACATRWPRG